MDEVRVNEILNSSRHAIVAMDMQLNVTYANDKVEDMFGLSKHVLFSMRNPLGIAPYVIESNRHILIQKESIPLNAVKLPDGNVLSVSGYISGQLSNNGSLLGVTVFADAETKKQFSVTSSKRRSFTEIRASILHSLKDGRKTINQLSKDVDINWKTVENHLTYLAGRQYISEVFSSEYVRIFGITDKGKKFLEQALLLNASEAKKSDEVTKEDYELSEEVRP